MENNQIGNKIRELRMRQGLTQAELGNVVGVSMQAVSKWERGGIPDIGVLLSLADYFQVTMDELLGRSVGSTCKLEDAVYNSIISCPEKRAFEQACDCCWAALKGVSAIPAMQAIGFTSGGADNPENTRCRITTDAGLAYAIATEEAHMITIMPEPAGGFLSVVGDLEEYTALFRLLGDPDVMLLFLYIGTRSPILFSKMLAAKETGICEETVERVFQIFQEKGWLAEETADVGGGTMKLYRTLYKESFVFFLIYAREITLKYRFLYMSNITKRSAPLLSHRTVARSKDCDV